MFPTLHQFDLVVLQCELTTSCQYHIYTTKIKLVSGKKRFHLLYLHLFSRQMSSIDSLQVPFFQGSVSTQKLRGSLSRIFSHDGHFLRHHKHNAFDLYIKLCMLPFSKSAQQNLNNKTFFLSHAICKIAAEMFS